jgi:Xaa-Pro aminopeptidase
VTGTAFAQRRERARRRALDHVGPGFQADGVPTWFLVTSLPNIRYLTGFSGSNAVLALDLRGPEGDLIGTDGRYQDQVRDECPGLPCLIDRATLVAMAGHIATAGPGSVLLESSITVQGLNDVRTAATGRGIHTAAAIIEELRVVKDEAELGLLERACAITSDAFAALFDEIRVGMTERAIARRLEQLFGDFGAQDRAFETIVGSGPNSAIPHHQPGERELQPGDLLVVDAGAYVHGYHADMTRTAVIAAAPTAWQQEVHDCVRIAQAAAVEAAAPGSALSSLDAVARDRITAAGYGDSFTHGLGHGVGLQIHEAPMISARSAGTIAHGTPITIEPGVYLTGLGGVRIEDTLVVETPGPRVLTPMSRNLMTIG